MAEPTPAADARPGETAAEATARTAVDESFGAYLDSLRVVWYRRIINFDQQAQVQLADDIRTATRTAASSLRARLEQAALDLRNWAQRPFDRDKLRLALLLGALLLVLTWSLWRIRSTGIWIGWRLGPQGRLELVRRQASHLLRRWERRFGRPDASAPAGERELHGALRRLRWGPPASPGGARRVLGEARRHLRQARARRAAADEA